MQPDNQSKRTRQKDTRRYPFFHDEFVTCSLVYDHEGHWSVEKSGASGEPVRLTLREFENTDTGKRMKAQLQLAIALAQDDL